MDKEEGKPMTAKELAEKTGKSLGVIYRLAKRYGRLPTEEEILSRSTGRPKKYWQ